MNKKVFLGGVIIGVSAAILSYITLNFAVGALRFQDQTNFTVENKVNYIASILDNHYIEDVDVDKVVEGAYYGMLDSVGDPYTTYLSAEQTSAYREQVHGSIQGIGVNVLYDTEKKLLIVVSAIEGTPAESAGILSGDMIYKVDGKNVTGMSSDDVIAMIKGPSGTNVTIVVKRGSEEIEFEITRSPIELASVYSKMLAGDIGYIEIIGFKANTYEQFMKEYEDLTDKGAKGLIIDVRDNPGGVVQTVNQIVDELIPKGLIMYTIDKDGNKKEYMSDEKSISIPLVVLINQNSASASEILAGAVHDSGTGELVGTKTFGKGLVQDMYMLPDGSAVKLTIEKYYTPSGICIHGDGIIPNYVVELQEGERKSVADEGYDTQLQKGVEVIKGKLN